MESLAINVPPLSFTIPIWTLTVGMGLLGMLFMVLGGRNERLGISKLTNGFTDSRSPDSHFRRMGWWRAGAFAAALGFLWLVAYGGNASGPVIERTTVSVGEVDVTVDYHIAMQDRDLVRAFVNSSTFLEWSKVDLTTLDNSVLEKYADALRERLPFGVSLVDVSAALR